VRAVALSAPVSGVRGRADARHAACRKAARAVAPSAPVSGLRAAAQTLRPSKASVHTVIAQFPSITSIDLSGAPAAAQQQHRVG